jgi:hypothetical protein
VAYKNKALMEFKKEDGRDDIDSDEEFDMSDIVVPDLGLEDHAIYEDYLEEVSEARYCNDHELTVHYSKLGYQNWVLREAKHFNIIGHAASVRRVQPSD